MTIGEKIKLCRKEKGLSQGELAALVDVNSPTIISNWENEKNKPDIDKLGKLCEALNCSPNYFFDYQETPHEISEHEDLLLQRYRRLDAFGQQVVDNNIDMQLERCILSSAPLHNKPAGAVKRPYFLKPSDPDYQAAKNKYQDLKAAKRGTYLTTDIILRLLWDKGYSEDLTLHDILLLEKGVNIPSKKLYNDYMSIVNGYLKQ